MPLLHATMTNIPFPDLAGLIVTLDAHPTGAFAFLCLVLLLRGWWRKGR